MNVQTERQIVPLPQEQVAIEDVKRLANIVLALRNEVFKEGHDFGKIPGTGDKPTLLQPGMEKLCRALRVAPRYTEQYVRRDYDKPLFHFEYLCELVDVDTGKIIPGGSGIGLCSSMESKYRYRKAARVCPSCGKEAIIKGKKEYGGGWLCFKNKDGCGAKYKDGDTTIESQPEGRVVNEDIFDQINTLTKMAQKRALGSAIKGAANVSEFFTVDLEDFHRYDTAPVVVTTDDGRGVDVESGEIVESPVDNNPSPTEPNPLEDYGSGSGAAFDAIPRNEAEMEAETDIQAVTTPLPQNLGQLKKLVIQDHKWVKGGTPHWDNLMGLMQREDEAFATAMLANDFAAMYLRIKAHYDSKTEDAA